MILDSDGRVRPFSCPLKLRAKGPDAARSYIPEAAPAPRSGIPVGLLAFLRYRASGSWDVRPLSPGQAILHLLRNAVSARRNPAGTLRAARRVVEAAPAFAGGRGEAAAAAGELFDLYERSWCTRLYSAAT